MPEITEQELEDYLEEKIVDVLKLERKKCNIHRQFSLHPYGIADLVVTQKGDEPGEVDVYIIELKKGKLDENALIQLIRYVHAFEESVEENESENLKLTLFPVLVGSALNLSSGWVYLVEYVNRLQIFTYKLNLEKGIYFNEKNTDGWTSSEPKERLWEKLDDFLSEYKSLPF